MALQVGELFAILTADDSEFNSVLNNAGDAFGQVGKKMSKIGANMTKKVTAPIVGAGIAILKLGGDFQESSNKVATIMDTNVVSLKKMKSGVLDLSNQTGISANKINEALYQTISATGDTANALEYTEIAAKTAIGGFTDTETAIDGLTSVMNAYGKTGVEEMQKVADIMIQTQNVGKTEVGELAKSLFQVIPTAAALGVSFEEVSAGMAAITSQGTPTSVAATQLRQLLVELSKASSKTSQNFEKLSGQSFRDFVAGGGDIATALKMMEEDAHKNNIALSDMFGSVEAGNAALQLTGDGAVKFADSLEAIENSSGSVDKAFDIMDEGINSSTKKIINNLKNIGIELSDIVLPAVEEFLEEIKVLIGKFTELDEGTQKSIIKFALFAAALGPVIFIIGKVITIIGFLLKVGGFLTTLFGALTTASVGVAGAGGLGGIAVAVGGLSAPVVALIAVILGLITGFVYLMATSEDFRKEVSDSIAKTFENLKTIVTGIIDFVIGGMKIAFGIMTGDLELIFEGFEQMVGGVASFIDGIIDHIKLSIESGISSIKRFLGFGKEASNLNLNKIVPASGGPHVSPAAQTIIKSSGAASRGSVEFADGGVVKASPGGILGTIGEGGEDELVSPLSTLKDMFGNVGNNISILVTGNTISSDYDIDIIGNQLVDRLFKAGIL